MPVIAQGTPSVKTVYGQKKEITPVVFGGDETFSASGVGFVDSGKNEIDFQGDTFPLPLIKFWRAMKILDHVPSIDHGTLTQCLHAASKNLDSTRHKHIERLAKQFEDRRALDQLISETLTATPSPQELTSMLMVVWDHRISTDLGELNAMVEAKEMRPHLILDALNQRARQERTLEAKLQWAELTETMAGGLVHSKHRPVEASPREFPLRTKWYGGQGLAYKPSPK